MAKEHKIAFIAASLDGGIKRNLEVQIKIAKEYFKEVFLIDLFDDTAMSACGNLPAILIKSPIARKRIKKILDEINPSIVQIHYLPYIPWVPLDYSSLIFVHGLPSGRLAFLLYFILARAFKKAAGAVFVSQQLKSDFERKIGSRIDRSWVIYDPIDAELFKPSDNRDKNLIVTCGRLAKSKRIELFLYSAEILSKKFPQLHFLIVGNGAERNRLEKLASQLNLTGKVEFRGFSNDWHKVLSNCGTLVLTSAYEGFGRVIAEAMACNIPVVTTALGGPQEMLAHKGGVIVSSRAQDIADAVEKILCNERYRDYITDNAREEVIEKYSCDIFKQKMISLWDCLLAKLFYR